jgi:signal transduction histidine kinase
VVGPLQENGALKKEKNSSIAERIIQRLVDVNKGWLLLLTIIFSEIFTFIWNVINGIVFYGRIDYTLLQIGVIDSFFVAVMVGGALIYFLTEIKHTQLSNVDLQEEINERKHAEERLEIAHQFLQSAYEDLKSLDEMKSNLIANVSHELRTPLYIAKGSLELAGDEISREERLKLLEMADEALTRQNLIIGDLMEASYLGATEIMLELDEVDINDSISYVTKQVEDLISQKDIKLEVNIEKNVREVKANKKQLAHVLSNLLGNAVKFSKKGGKISINAIKKGRFVELSVADNGVGIAEESLPKVFDKFFQADATTGRAYGGTGMGLAVVKEIIETHGGNVGVESKLEKGSRFYFTLQIAK